MKLTLLLVLFICYDKTWSHPLFDYVRLDDGAFAWEELSSKDYGDVTFHSVNMTSQKWMTDEYSSQSIWFHYMGLIVPKEILIPDRGFIFIGLGDNDDGPIDPDEDLFLPVIADLARRLGAVCTLLNQVPNQPIVYGNDESGRSRSEDSSIAWTWVEWIEEKKEFGEADPNKLLLFPMTKSVTRAMDAITAFMDERYDTNVETYVVGGPSKRGWTTYLAAAVDDRITAIAPQVLSIMNFIPNMHHHYQSLGGWSWAFRPYWELDLTPLLDSEYTQELVTYIDPYYLRENLTMPKLIVKAALDEFFMLDDAQFFLGEMPGTTYIWVLENTNHPMLGQWERLAYNIESFFLLQYNDIPYPTYSYTSYADETSGSITMTLDRTPVRVYAFYAMSASNDRRDWRFLRYDADSDRNVVNGVLFTVDDVDDLGDNTYRISYDAPSDGYLGFFITAELEGPGDSGVFEFSSEPVVIPSTFPYEDCTGDSCLGTIV